VVSGSNPKGQGRAPDGCISFNPSYIPKSDTFSQAGIYVRLCCGTSCVGHGASFTGDAHAERIGFAPCDLETGVCQDVVADFNLDPTTDTEDPRAFYYDSSYYLFSYSGILNHTGCTGGSCTVRLQKTKTPLDAASYVNIGLYNWHRNGCCAMKPKGQKSYCIWGEGPSPFPGLGISYTTDIDQGLFTQAPWSVASGVTSPVSNDSMWMLPLGKDEQEIKLEAGAHPQLLSTGDWIHFYAAATPGWVSNGNYTAGYIILDKDDPSKIIQRESGQWMIPRFEYETLCNGATDCKYKGERKNVIFLCSATPMASGKDKFRLFFGGGDGNVGTAIVQVTASVAR